MTGTGAAGVVAALRSVVDDALEVDLGGLDAVEFTALLEAVEVQRRRLEAVDARLLATADEQLVAAHHCRSSTADLLVHQLRVSPGEARARVRRARDLGPRHTLQGEPLEPTHPLLAAAQRAGEISAQQVDIATKTLGLIPSDIAADATPAAEEFLLKAARNEAPPALARSASMLLDLLDPDGREPRTADEHGRLTLHRTSGGSWKASGSLTDECGLVWQTILDALSAPAPAVGGERDARTTAERTHDAFRDLGIRLLRSGVPTDSGTSPLTVVVRARPRDLGEPDGLCQTDHGHVMRTSALRHLLGDATIIPLLFDRARSDCALLLGRTQRLANRAQRRALAARDGGCSFPGCDVPASWCQAHHVVEWAAGGPTDIDNLTLVCGFHHREFERRGWRVEMLDGLPHWIPPRWLDPDRRPRVNTAHHLPEIVFDPGGAITAIRR